MWNCRGSGGSLNCTITLPQVYCLNNVIQVYWLPPEAGEKVSLGVTVLLAFSMFQVIILESTPENSDFTPLLSECKHCHVVSCHRLKRYMNETAKTLQGKWLWIVSK